MGGVASILPSSRPGLSRKDPLGTVRHGVIHAVARAGSVPRNGRAAVSGLGDRLIGADATTAVGLGHGIAITARHVKLGRSSAARARINRLAEGHGDILEVGQGTRQALVGRGALLDELKAGHEFRPHGLVNAIPCIPHGFNVGRGAAPTGGRRLPATRHLPTRLLALLVTPPSVVAVGGEPAMQHLTLTGDPLLEFIEVRLRGAEALASRNMSVLRPAEFVRIARGRFGFVPLALRALAGALSSCNDGGIRPALLKIPQHRPIRLKAVKEAISWGVCFVARPPR